MSERIHVATRKGLLTLNRNSSGKWEFGETAFLGAPVTMCLADPRNGDWYAAIDHGHFGTHLHRSRNEGKEWQEIAVPKYPEGAVLPERMPEDTGTPKMKAAALTEIWALEPGGPDQPGRLWCGTIPGGLFRSDDHGDSWNLVDSLWNREERMKMFGGGKDDPGIHSVFVDPRDSQKVTIANSCGGVWQTTDGGESWQCSQGLRAEYMPPDQAYDPVVQDPHRLAACEADPSSMWVQHHNGIFHSTDGGANWEEIRDVKPSSFGFAVSAHPTDPQTAWFVPGVKDEFRYPVDGRLVVTKTTDGGKSFTAHGKGLPEAHAYDIVFRHALDVDSSGDRLAMGSSTGNFWISEDGGESWQTISNHLAPIYAVRFVR